MMPDGVISIDHGIEAVVAFNLKTQLPSTLEWRLGVKVRHTCRFETTVTFGHTIRPYRSAAAGPLARPAASYIMFCARVSRAFRKIQSVVAPPWAAGVL